MKSKPEIVQILQSYHELGQTETAALFLLEEFDIKHPNFKGFALREKAEPNFIADGFNSLYFNSLPLEKTFKHINPTTSAEP